MDEAEYCDRVSIMVDGRIEALDTPKALKKTYDATNMDEVFLKLARTPTGSPPEGEGNAVSNQKHG
jgi:ABC-2 type transport system ATP-binding protein